MSGKLHALRVVSGLILVASRLAMAQSNTPAQPHVITVYEDMEKRVDLPDLVDQPHCDRMDLFSRIELKGRWLTIAPAQDVNGVANCEDSQGYQLKIQILPVNDAPSIVGPSVWILHDGRDPESDALSLQIHAGHVPSPGRTMWESEAVNVSVSCRDPGLFEVFPRVSADGRLRGQSAPGVTGETNCTLTARDADGLSSAPHTVRVSFVASDPPPVLEAVSGLMLDDVNQPARVRALLTFSGGRPGEPIARLEATAEPTTLFDGPVDIDSSGLVLIQPAGRSGDARLLVRAFDALGQSSEVEIPLRIGPNVRPSLRLGRDQIELEVIGEPVEIPGIVADLSAGEYDTAQTVTVEIKVEDSSFFSEAPYVTPNGGLRLALSGRAGQTRIALRARDDGGTERGAVDLSEWAYLVVRVSRVNRPPRVQLNSTALRGLEDQRDSRLGPGQVRIDAGPDIGLEPPPTVRVTARLGAELLEASPSYDPASGGLRVPLKQNANGLIALEIVATDSGGLSSKATLKLEVGRVNDAPSFQARREVFVDAPGAQVIPWVTSRSAGPADERDQRVRVVVRPDRPDQFVTLPEVDAQGNLRFTLQPSFEGRAQLVAWAEDNGGTEVGGLDRSESYAFEIVRTLVKPAGAREALPIIGDWVSTLVYEYYGNEGRMFLPYVCEYNKQQKRIIDCDEIEPGQKLLLPPAAELRCMMLRDAGAACRPTRNELRDELLANIPPEARECVNAMEKARPDLHVAYLIIMAKAIADEVGLDSDRYLDECDAEILEAKQGFVETPVDYISVDPDGKPVIVNYWGPEDY